MGPRDKDEEEEKIPDTEPSPALGQDPPQDPLQEGFRKGDAVVEEDDGDYG